MSWRTRNASVLADALALRLSTAPLGPSPTFQASLRLALMAEAAMVLKAATPVVRTHVRSRPSTLSAIAAAAAAALGLVGMTAASASALPGDVLYPVKRGVENTQLALKLGDSDRGAFRLELAGQRLKETYALTERGSVRSELEAQTIEDYSEQANLGVAALVRSFEETKRRGDIIAINRFANRVAVLLGKLEGRLERGAEDALASAQAQLTTIVSTSTPTSSSPTQDGQEKQRDSATDSDETSDSPSAAPASPAPSVSEEPDDAHGHEPRGRALGHQEGHRSGR